MKTSDRGRAFIAAHEGVVLRAYRDVAGVWTIGVGHTARAGGLRPKAGMTISRETAEVLLSRDLARFEARVSNLAIFKAQTAFDGAVSFDFNTGRIHNASWVRHYRSGLFARAEASLMQWTLAGGRVVAGLKRRRRSEADLIFCGLYGPEQGEPAASAAAFAPGGGPDASDAGLEVLAYQRQLKKLKFYKGAIDGLAGPRTRSAIRAFQRAHPQLNEDGIVGPATRAALTRAVSALKGVGHAGGGAAASGGGAGVLAEANADWGVALSIGLGVGLAALVLVGGYFAWRYRDELKVLVARL